MLERKANKAPLIVLGFNMVPWGTDITSIPDHLSQPTKFNLLAASIYCQHKGPPAVIFSSGHTAGFDMPSEAYAMYEYWEREFPQLSHIPVLLEDRSKSTTSNGHETLKIVRRQGFQESDLLSLGDHARNAKRLLTTLGHNIRNIYATELVIAYHLKSQGKTEEANEFLDHFYSYALLSGVLLREIIRETLLDSIDPKGDILDAIANKTRK